jgi:transposase-like protein
MVIRYSPQFKDQVIQFSLAHPEQTLLHTAKQFGIGNSTLDKWLRGHRLTNGGKVRNGLSADQQRIAS